MRSKRRDWLSHLACVGLLVLHGCCQLQHGSPHSVPSVQQKKIETAQEEKWWDTVMLLGERANLAFYAPETLRRIDAGQSLTLHDIHVLSKLGFSDEVIGYQLARTETQFNLTTEQVQQLLNSGLRSSIMEMLAGTSQSTKQADGANSK